MYSVITLKFRVYRVYRILIHCHPEAIVKGDLNTIQNKGNQELMLDTVHLDINTYSPGATVLFTGMVLANEIQ